MVRKILDGPLTSEGGMEAGNETTLRKRGYKYPSDQRTDFERGRGSESLACFTHVEV